MKKQFFAAVGAILTLMGAVSAIPQNAMATIDSNRENLETAPVLITRISRWSNSISMALRRQPVTELLPTHVMVMYVSQKHSTVLDSEKSLEEKDLPSIKSNFDMLIDIDVKDIPNFEEGVEINFNDENGTMVVGHDGISQISTHNVYYFVKFGDEENYEYGRVYYGMCSMDTGYLRVSGTECRLTPEQLYSMNAYKVAKQEDEYTELNEFGIYEAKAQDTTEAEKIATEEELARLKAEKAAIEEEIALLQIEKNEVVEAIAEEKEMAKAEIEKLEAEKTAAEEKLAELEAKKIATEEKLAELEAKFAQLETEKVTLEEELLRLETEKTALEEKNASLETEKTTLGEEIARLETKKSEAEKISLTRQTEVVKTAPIIAYVAEDNSVYENQVEKIEAKELELPALGEEKTCEEVEEKSSFFDNWWWAITLVSFLLGGLFLDIKVYKTSRK